MMSLSAQITSDAMQTLEVKSKIEKIEKIVLRFMIIPFGLSSSKIIAIYVTKNNK